MATVVTCEAVDLTCIFGLEVALAEPEVKCGVFPLMAASHVGGGVDPTGAWGSVIVTLLVPP